MGPSDEAVRQAWLISIGLFLAVGVVVAVLLTMILRTARQIRDGAAAIWTSGKLVAANTVHIPMLITTNRLAGQIHTEAAGILQAAGRILQHAEGCPGCPECVLAPGGRR